MIYIHVARDFFERESLVIRCHRAPSGTGNSEAVSFLPMENLAQCYLSQSSTVVQCDQELQVGKLIYNWIKIDV